MTRLDHATARALARIARQRSEVSPTNAELAELARCTVRAVQVSLRRLASAGWLLISRAPGRIQRRITILFWITDGAETRLHARTDVRPSEDCTHEAPCAPEPPPPNNPPNTGDNNDDDDTPSSASPTAIEYAPPIEETCPQSSSSSPPLRNATPEEIGQVVTKAFSLWGASQETRDRVRSLARIYRLSWVDRALEVCLARAKREPVGFPFLLSILKNWSREGGPPPAPARLATAAAPARPELAPPPAPAPELEASSEDLAELEKRAQDPRHPLHRLALVMLGRMGPR